MPPPHTSPSVLLAKAPPRLHLVCPSIPLVTPSPYWRPAPLCSGSSKVSPHALHPTPFGIMPVDVEALGSPDSCMFLAQLLVSDS